MKLKVLVLSFVLCMAALPRLHAFGLGAQFNLSAGDIFAPGAALLISPSDMTHLAVNWYIDRDKVNIIGLTLDIVPLTLPIKTFGAGSFNFTLGAGLFGNLTFDDKAKFDGGLRIPLGVNLLLGKDALEIFANVAPSFGIHFLPSLGLSDPFFPIALGVRLWLR